VTGQAATDKIGHHGGEMAGLLNPDAADFNRFTI
jgi:hypothetical protein